MNLLVCSIERQVSNDTPEAQLVGHIALWSTEQVDFRMVSEHVDFRIVSTHYLFNDVEKVP